MNTASTGLLILWFVVIVALIPVSLWLLKRSGLASGAMGAGAAPVRQVAQLNLGPGQRIVTVEVGEGESRTWLVLGVTSQQINTLHSMPPMSLPVPEGESMPVQFASLLRSKLAKPQEPQ
ncbi:MAG: flagellar biosynthetic protein FliO [Aquabacterium sp.]|jgi:flagellar protein FliO/FliZ|uniref:FliO/MopB family protein n=1 Tax=Aquabacterium sp. TaxID=1872578 RepID=UPI001B561B51|nr:flagellar biosynthetic protein FliO [Aquabacterium sp.]MBP7132119.1 flagellar biosynthetic protein FliO [Aquabacterium sp.]MBP9062428.1 flagellar biosynthetic protein FliO [Aquabacterium sp.]MDQ5927533.1 flagellar protein FliO/FliZ [Pseudomonadota bacterium]